jgi:DNA-binding transcriptional regulator YhcF (GntR family)
MLPLTAHRLAPRVASRIAAQFLLRCLRQIGDMFDGNVKLGVAFLTIAQSTCLSPSLQADERYAGIRAMSASLGIPYETMRRYVVELVEAGMCERCGKGGVAVASTAHARQAVADVHSIVLEQFLQMLCELENVGFNFAWIRTGTDNFTGGDDRRAFLMCSAASFLLRLLEVNVPVFNGDVTMVAVWMALACESVRAVTYNKDLAWKYGDADTPIPDELRRPVSVAAVAQSLAMPFETTRRHLARLADRQLCMRVSRTGFMVPQVIVITNRVDQIGSLIALRLFQSVAALGRAGFSFPALLAQAEMAPDGDRNSDVRSAVRAVAPPPQATGPSC